MPNNQLGERKKYFSEFDNLNVHAKLDQAFQVCRNTGSNTSKCEHSSP